MYSIVVGERALRVARARDLQWCPVHGYPMGTHPDDLFDVSIYLSLSVEQVTVVLASAARTLRYVHCKGSTASKLSPILLSLIHI